MNIQKPLLIIFILTALLLPSLYFLLLQHWVDAYFQGTSPQWFNSVIEFFYPRIITEKNRFPLSFFKEKALQVVLRTSFILLILSAYLYFKERLSSFKNQVQNYFDQDISSLHITILRILFYASLLYFSIDFYADLISLRSMSIFFKPIPLLKVLHIGFPTDGLILVVYAILISSCILCLLNILPIVNSIITIFAFIYFQAIIFSFEKIDHGYTTLTYAGLLLPFIFIEKKKGNTDSTKISAWPIQLIKLVLCLCYLLAGLEKLFISKGAWLSTSTFENYIYLHQAPLGLKLLKYPFLCTIFPIGAMLFQLGFISILWKKKLLYVFLPVGIMFHLGTVLLFGISSVINPWIFTYIFFIPWNDLIKSSK